MHKKLLEKITKLNSDDNFSLIIVGANGSGKTTLVRQIVKILGVKKYYTVNNNRQFSQPDVFNQDEYNKGIMAHILSSGESLFDQLSDLVDEDQDFLIMDEPTATLDFFHSSLLLESFIRNRVRLKIITSNDYTTLRILQGYIDKVYSVEEEKMISLKDYINKGIDDTISEIKNKSPFKEVNFEIYESMKVKDNHEEHSRHEEHY